MQVRIVLSLPERTLFHLKFICVFTDVQTIKYILFLARLSVLFR